jgi:hypothetical protein
MKKDFSEQDLIDFYIGTNQKGLIVPLVLKGLASVLKVSEEIRNVFDIPYIGNKLSLVSILSGGVLDAFGFLINSKPSLLLKNKKFTDIISRYYKNLREGDAVSKAGKNKSSALNYYVESLGMADALFKNFRNAFEKKVWLCDLLKADALSYMGSINTATEKFSEGITNFENSLLTIDAITKNHEVFPVDRMIEIASYNLSNDLRNRESIERFITNNGVKDYDDKFDSFISIAEKEYNRFSYASNTSIEILNFLQDNYIPQKKFKNDFNSVLANIQKMLYNNHHVKLNRALGKYLTIRGCYDFILLRLKLGDSQTHINEIQSKISRGLAYATKSELKNTMITVEEYLKSSEFVSDLQMVLARNFTILYGFGHFIDSSVVKDDNLKKLSLLYIKEKKNNDVNIVNFNNSIYESIKKVLGPYNIMVSEDYLMEQIRLNAAAIHENN